MSEVIGRERGLVGVVPSLGVNLGRDCDAVLGRRSGEGAVTAWALALDEGFDVEGDEVKNVFSGNSPSISLSAVKIESAAKSAS